MLKKFLFATVLGLSALSSHAADPQITISQMAPRWGTQHVHICTSADWGCGSNPPTYQIPAKGITPGTGPDSGRPVGCGTIYSTSHARNTDGSLSTKGVKMILPTVAMMAAAGMTGDRDAQCEIEIVMGAPGPQQYLTVAMDGAVGIDKFTALPTGAGDMVAGEFTFPYRTPCTISFAWNKVSWLLKHACGDVAEILGNGQLMAQGGVRLFRVTQNPPWWTVTSRIGTVALCPENGNGIIGPSNGGDMLMRLSPTCVFEDFGVGGASTDWITLGFAGAAGCTNITQGSAYAGGTAPDGTVYSGGNYVRITGCILTNFSDGNTVNVYGGKSTLGTRFTGKWIGMLVGADLELHEEVTHLGVSAPSSFVAGDSITAGLVPILQHQFLATSGVASPRQAWYANGAEIQGGTTRRTIVGLTRGNTDGSGLHVDTNGARHVASLYQPVRKKSLMTTAADRSTNSLTFVEMAGSGDLRSSFVYLNGIGSLGTVYGDNTNGSREVGFTAHIEASNNTNGDGCQFTVLLDGVAQTNPVVGFTNPAAENGRHFFLTLRATLNGLTEAAHTLSIAAKAVTGGTCTVYSAGTSIETTFWQ